MIAAPETILALATILALPGVLTAVITRRI